MPTDSQPKFRVGDRIVYTNATRSGTSELKGYIGTIIEVVSSTSVRINFDTAPSNYNGKGYNPRNIAMHEPMEDTPIPDLFKEAPDA